MRLLAITPFLGALGLALQPGAPAPQSTAKAPEPLRLPPKTAQPAVELLLPAAVEKQTMIIGGALSVDAVTREAQISGDTTIRLPNGVQLRVHQAHLKLMPADAMGDQRVLITPLPEPSPAK